MTVRVLLALIPLPVLVAIGLIVFYEGVPLPQWLRDTPFIGSKIEELVDGRVDRVARAATEKLVDKAKVDKAEAEAEAARIMLKSAQKRADDLAEINAKFDADLIAAQTELELLNVEIDDVLSATVDGACTIDRSIFDRLRNK
ncbi:MAG: hypothetical protein U5K75_05480 [Ahrensia sp.]|nr:hypothetical protein [Ahrensia sp.]